MSAVSKEVEKNASDFVSVFELIYSFLFLGSILTVGGSYLEILAKIKNQETIINKNGVAVFIVLGIVSCIQYAKIYFNIHHLELIPRNNDSHFLRLYKNHSTTCEKIIRLLLVCIILFGTKFLVNNTLQVEKYFMVMFREIKNNNDINCEILHTGESHFIPLAAAFLLLIIWDCIALYVIGKNSDKISQIDDSAREFFCFNDKSRTLLEYKYWGSQKMFERVFGLLLFILAILYVETSFDPLYSWLVGCAFMGYIVLLTINEGKEKIINYFKDPFNLVENFFSENSTIRVGRVTKYFAVLVFIFLAFFKMQVLFASPLPQPVENVSQQKQVNEQNKLTKTFILATSKNLWCALPLIALKNGYFANHGLNISPNYQTAGRYNMDALLSKSADFASVVEVNLALLAISVPADVKIVGTVVESKDFSVIARRSAGINRISDLKDKRIAFSPGTGGEYFARNFYRVNNLPETPNTFFKVQPNALQDSIRERAVDAVATWEPFVSNIRTGLGDDAVILRDDKAYTGYMNIAVRKSWSDQHGDDTKSFLLALRDAQEFIRKNPEDAQKIMSDITTLPIETIKNIWHLFDFKLTLNVEAQINATRTVGELAVATDPAFVNNKVPDYRTFFDDQYIKNLESPSINVLNTPRSNTSLLPDLENIFTSLGALFCEQKLHFDIGYTILRMSIAYILASLVGILAGLLIGYYAMGYLIALPVVDFFRSTPVTVLYPVFVLIFGVGSEAKIAMTFTACVFVIILNTAYGVRSASPIRIANVKLLGASQFQILRYVIIRDATPHILVGMRTALSLALIVSILVEMFMGSNFGIGQKVIEAYTSYRIADVYALILVTGGLGYLLNLLFVRFEKSLSYWYWNERSHP